MNQIYYNRSTCRLCESNNLTETLKLEPTPVGDKYLPVERSKENRQLVPLGLFLCKVCGHIQTGSVVYPDNIYVHYLSRPAAVNPVLSEAYRSYGEDIISRYKPNPENLIVEIGSNDGAFLKFFKDNGFPVIGIDPAANLAESASQIGINTLPTFFTYEISQDIKKKYGLASVFIANFVYANIDNIIDATQGIRNLLDKEGVFIFETNYRLDVFQKDLIETINHEHLSYFSIAPLQKFFDDQGMELIEVQRVPSKGGSIRCTVQLSGGSRKVDKSVQDLISIEHKTEMYSSDFYTKCGNHIKSVREDMKPILDEITEYGYTLAGYGTSIGATILIYQLGLGKVMSFLVDDDPYRQNLVSPGYNLPVLSSKSIYDNNPEYVAILAPLYAKQIMSNNERYLRQKGKFLNVWPNVNVYGENNLEIQN